jgi:DNA polymerase II small subunit/DNA polymerase delta subunit B
MKKHRINKIREISGASQSEITPEHHQKNVERVVDMIMSVYERLPANPAPVSESIEDLLNEMRHGIKRQPTIIRTSESDTKIVSVGAEKKGSEIVTLHNSGDSEKKGSENVTKFDLSELEILRKIENGES